MRDHIYPKASSSTTVNQSTTNPIINSPPISGQHNLQSAVNSPPISDHHSLKSIVNSPPISDHHNLQPMVNSPPISNQHNLQQAVNSPPISDHHNLKPIVNSPPISRHHNLQPAVNSPPTSRHHNLKSVLDSPPISGEHRLKPIVESPPISGEHHRPTPSQESFSSSTRMSYTGSGPRPGTYVVQVPKDQIYRVPPPENAHKFKLYTQRKARQSRCRSCCCYTLIGMLILAFLLAGTGAILYVIFRPKVPSYSVERIHVTGFNLSTSAGPTADVTLSPVFNVTVKTKNRNGKIGIYYQRGSSVKVYHNGVNLCDGKLPVFYQPSKNVTVFSTELSGSGIVLSKLAREKLVKEQDSGKVPLVMEIEVPVKIKVGAVKTWKITVKVSCDITMNELTEKAKVLSKDCKAHAKPW